MAENSQPKVTSIKTYVRGSFLYADDGYDYQDKHREAHDAIQRIVEDKIGISQLRKQFAQKKKEMKRKKQHKNQKPVLIPIRDTPVEPVPQPVNDNQKCQRSTQEQFQYFQSYINQIEKQKKFQEQQQIRLDLFQLEQQIFRQKKQEQVIPSRGIALVMEKQAEKPKKKSLMRITIKKRQATQDNIGGQTSKIRVLNQ